MVETSCTMNELAIVAMSRLETPRLLASQTYNGNIDRLETEDMSQILHSCPSYMTSNIASSISSLICVKF